MTGSHQLRAGFISRESAPLQQLLSAVELIVLTSIVLDSSGNSLALRASILSSSVESRGELE